MVSPRARSSAASKPQRQGQKSRRARPAYNVCPIRRSGRLKSDSHQQRRTTMAASRYDRTRDSMVADFGAVLDEAEDLMQQAAKETGDRASNLRAQVEEKLGFAKQRLQEFSDDAVDRSKAAARATDDYVHDNPWQVVGVAVAIGFVFGMLVNRDR